MRSVEIKAKITDYENFCKEAEKLSDVPSTITKLDDTYFKVNKGRLKMRIYPGSSVFLVRYNRANEVGSRTNNYQLLDFSANESKKAILLHGILEKCLGIHGRLLRQRKLFIVDNILIHADNVRDLGRFVKIKVLLKSEQSLQEGQAIAQDLRTKLGIKDEDLINCDYLDLLVKKKN